MNPYTGIHFHSSDTLFIYLLSFKFEFCKCKKLTLEKSNTFVVKFNLNQINHNLIISVVPTTKIRAEEENSSEPLIIITQFNFFYDRPIFLFEKNKRGSYFVYRFLFVLILIISCVSID